MTLPGPVCYVRLLASKQARNGPQRAPIVLCVQSCTLIVLCVQSCALIVLCVQSCTLIVLCVQSCALIVLCVQSCALMRVLPATQPGARGGSPGSDHGKGKHPHKGSGKKIM